MAQGEEKTGKRTGRPAKNPALGKRINVMFRLNEATRDRLMSAADLAGRSMSEEIERRIDRSFEDVDLLLAYFGSRDTLKLAQSIAFLSRAVESKTGKKWEEDPETKGQFIAALSRFEEIYFHEQGGADVPVGLPPLGALGLHTHGWNAAELVAEAMGLRSKARDEMDAFLATPEGKAALERARKTTKAGSPAE